MSDKNIKCVACGSPTSPLGEIPLLIRDKDPKGKLPSWVDVLFYGHKLPSPKSVWPIDVFRCTSCGRLEMYDLDNSLPSPGEAEQ